MKIRKTVSADLNNILQIHRQAFGGEEGMEIADLVNDLMVDRTAMPLLSLIAEDNNKPIGHVLFTKAKLNGADENTTVQILAPLAVIPEEHSKGVGGLLIKEGLNQLKSSGVELVFVLGHPAYYPRYGFQTAGKLGYKAPYPIPEEHADAWMVQELRSGVIGRATGAVQCSDVLNQPQHWRE